MFTADTALKMDIYFIWGLLSPFVALLFNKSLSAGCFPAMFTLAMIHPLLKKSEHDSSQMKNYQPVFSF